MQTQALTLLITAGVIFIVLGLINITAHIYSLNIKSKTVGNGQHGTARFASKSEIKKTYRHIPFNVQDWREGKNLPKIQGIIVGCKSTPNGTTALIDDGDVHALMVGAAGIGKTAYFLYPNLGVTRS
jgi:type IV secretion system protein VirD4